jgi:glycosyltransferase involved in cell wall biosynthesis
MKYESSELNVAIGILARDCAESLKRNMPIINRMCHAFKSYTIVVYENDSKDETKDLLKSWSAINPNVKTIMEDTQTVTIPVETKDNPFPAKSKYRIGKMVNFRNRLMDEISKINPDICIFIDIDLKWINPDMVAQAIDNAPEGWGGLFGNGKVMRKYPDCMSERPFLYDSYAYVDKGVDPYAVGKWLYDGDFHPVTGTRMYFDIKKNAYHPCTSAFNNIGIYKWEAIKDLRYEVVQTPEIEPVNVALCEHVPFNLSVEKKGYGNYMVRDLVVHSECMDVKDYTKWHNRWKKKHEVLHYFSKHRRIFVKILYHKLLLALGLKPYIRRKE